MEPEIGKCYVVFYKRQKESVFKTWSRRRDLNPRPADYKSAALPLSYAGLVKEFGIMRKVTAMSNPEPAKPLFYF
jgi:hypothetical protein